MDVFKDKYRNQINLAICGPVSVGKGTLLNSIFVATYSDMKIKRTTMNPQVYYEVSNKNNLNTSEIRKEIMDI